LTGQGEQRREREKVVAYTEVVLAAAGSDPHARVVVPVDSRLAKVGRRTTANAIHLTCIHLFDEVRLRGKKKTREHVPISSIPGSYEIKV